MRSHRRERSHNFPSVRCFPCLTPSTASHHNLAASLTSAAMPSIRVAMLALSLMPCSPNSLTTSSGLMVTGISAHPIICVDEDSSRLNELLFRMHEGPQVNLQRRAPVGVNTLPPTAKIATEPSGQRVPRLLCDLNCCRRQG